MTNTTSLPLYIQVNSLDNVAIVVNEGGLPAGTQFKDGLTLIHDIPQGHKVALVDIADDDAIIRYGEIIGYAIGDLKQGSWINEQVTRMPTAPLLTELPIATNVPAPLPPLSGYTFEGYRNADGSVGTRN